MSRYRVLPPSLRRQKGAGRRGRIRGLVRSDDKGFSLIEVLVSIGVFAIIATFMAQTLATGMHGVLLGKRREIATQEANRVLEIARSLSYNAVGLIQTDPSITSDDEIETQGGKLSYEVNSAWEPIMWSTNPSGHPFNPHIQDVTRGSTQLRRYVYVTGVNTDSDATTFELKRVLAQVEWTGGGTAGPDNFVRAQTLINESGLVLEGGTSPLTAETFATGGSLKVNSSLLGLLSTPVEVGLPTSRGESSFRIVSSTNCTTSSARIAALNLVDLPGYSAAAAADDDSRTATPSNPAPDSESGVLTIPGGAVLNLLGPVINSPVSCEAEADGLAHEEGAGSALSVLNAVGSAGLLGVLNLANVSTSPVTQEITHETVNDQREVAASAGGSFGQVRLLQLTALSEGLVQFDSINFGATVRGAEGTPSAAPTVTASDFTLRVHNSGNTAGTPCAGGSIAGISATQSGSYCVITVDLENAGFPGLSIDITRSFGIPLLANLSSAIKIDILPVAKSPIAGVTGPNGERRWSAEYSPITVSASLDASTLLGIPLIDADVDLRLGGVSAKACAGATC
jgi:prepilin-type N-terminal cleavage/methylation domain-containing protein